MLLKIKVPATTANIGPGFDIWGMALNLYNTFSCEITGENKEKPEFSFSYSPLVKSTTNADLDQLLSNPENNYFYKSFCSIFQQLNLDIPQIKLSVNIEIPLSRGLGSSSTSIIAGMLAANEYIRHFKNTSFHMSELFQLAVQMEGHPDNIAPALYGGWVLSIYDDKLNIYTPVLLPVEAPVKLAGVIPHITLATKDARKVISQSHHISTIAYQSSRTALMTWLLTKKVWHAGDRDLFKKAIQDKIHQTQRSALIPGMLDTFNYWMEQGALAAYLSGAGTTLLSFWDEVFNFDKIDLKKVMGEAGIEATPFYPAIDRTGTIIETISI